jgi:N-acetylglucosaminyldiphosphoundecaprenol N-acetyl-beta-D-mannosaminyltransferase
MSERAAVPVRHLFGVPIAALRMAEVLERVDAAVRRGETLHLGVVNAAKLVNMRADGELRSAVLSSDLILADGMSVVWASRLLGRALPERVTGIDLMLRMLAVGHARGYRVYCLGATAAVLERVIARIAVEYPGVRVVGRCHGYFSPEEEPRVARDITEARPDILFVAMTSPRKERFLARWRAQLRVPVTHGVGGSFDVFAGEVRRAPERWQRLGLEWLYRLRQEPRRLARRYLATNAQFCAMVAAEGARAMASRARERWQAAAPSAGATR